MESPEHFPYGKWMRANFVSNWREGKWGSGPWRGRSSVGDFGTTTAVNSNKTVEPIISEPTQITSKQNQIIDDVVLVSNSKEDSYTLQGSRKGGYPNSPNDVMEQSILKKIRVGAKDTVCVEDGTEDEGMKPLVAEASIISEWDISELIEVPVLGCMVAESGP